MKKQLRLFIIVFFIVSLSSTAYAEKRKSWLTNTGDKTTGKIAAGARLHFDYAEFDRIPIQEDDYSYLLFYEIHNEFAYWQIGGAFTPGPEDNRFDHIITPQLNLIAKDSIYRLGVGALISNVKMNDDSDWTRVYWQGIFGIGIPIGRFGIDLYGHYVFESWNKPGEPASEAPEVSLLVNFSF